MSSTRKNLVGFSYNGNDIYPNAFLNLAPFVRSDSVYEILTVTTLSTQSIYLSLDILFSCNSNLDTDMTFNVDVFYNSVCVKSSSVTTDPIIVTSEICLSTNTIKCAQSQNSVFLKSTLKQNSFYAVVYSSSIPSNPVNISKFQLQLQVNDVLV